MPNPLKALLLAVLLASSHLQASDFYDNYQRGHFEAAFGFFEQEVNNSNQIINYENLIDIMQSIYPQLEGVPLEALDSKLSLLDSRKLPIFVRKRLRSDLAALSHYEALVNADPQATERAIEAANAIVVEPLKYNHKKKSNLRIIKMAINNRRHRNISAPADDYLYALAEHGISRGGEKALERYFLKASEDDAYYSKALELAEKLSTTRKY